MPSPIEQAIRQICDEKGLAYESVIDAIQAALAAAYRKDFGDKNQNIDALFNPEDGSTRVFDVKTVVEDMDLAEIERAEEERRLKAEQYASRIEEARAKGEDIVGIEMETVEGPEFNPKTDIMLSEARVLKFGSQVGDVLRLELPQPGEFGRTAAMTAKQVITQKLREAEREVVFNEFKEHEGKVLSGTVQRQEGRMVLIDIGRSTGILRAEDQVPTERYRTGDRIRVYVSQVTLTTKGPQIVLSRASDEFVRKMFEMEIPEVSEGSVEIKSVAREAGSRSKVAVTTRDAQIDPIGACIGQRGTRIQTIISELGGEKVDIIEWNEDAATFIAHALSPARVNRVELNGAETSALVHVNPDQLSLAIGKGGQNVRLAARLTGWKINIAEIGDKKGLEEPTVAVEAPVEAADVPVEESKAE
jgi:N utilization substance protein A